jgi:hypothetical protein
MRSLTSRIALAALLTLGLAGTGATARAATGDDIATQLKAIPGITLTESTVLPELPDEHYYELTFKQPVDHLHPKRGYFEQRIRILHKSIDRPVVLFATGYDLYTAPSYRSEPTKLLDADQVSVEQRFFTPSRPEPADWSKLNIWQAATDHHLIVQALKKIYKHNKWISTGASKGGMTSVYHRRFYPNDVNATVAYVAPDNPDKWNNKPYDNFFNTVGTAECRAALNGLQQEALNRRAEFEKLIAAQAEAANAHFTIIGNIDRDFEATVIDFRWGFWQYNLASECANIPPRTASTQTIFDYIDANDPFLSDSDESVAEFVPYFYQAATQLGEPDPSTAYLKGLHYAQGLDTSKNLIPESIKLPRFDYRAMPDIDHWVKTRGSRMMFLYGGNDPWGVKPFRLGPGTRDSLWYSVAGQRHSGSLISVLPSAQQAEAIATLKRWAGESTTATATIKSLSTTADDQDPLLTVRPPL